MNSTSRTQCRSSPSVATDHDDSSSSFIDADGRVVDISNLCIGSPLPSASPRRNKLANKKPLSRRRLLPSVGRDSPRRPSQSSVVYQDEEDLDLSMPELASDISFAEPQKRSIQAVPPQSWKSSPRQQQQYQPQKHRYSTSFTDSASTHTRSTSACSSDDNDSLSHYFHLSPFGESSNRSNDYSPVSSRSVSCSPIRRQRNQIQYKKPPPPPAPLLSPTPRSTTSQATQNRSSSSSSNTPVEIEVAPGMCLPLRGSNETMMAVDCGRAVTVSCFMCETSLCCVQDCQLVLCPECRILSPVEDHCPKLYHSLPHLGGWQDDEEDENEQVTRNGVGLGLKVDLLNH